MLNRRHEDSFRTSGEMTGCSEEWGRKGVNPSKSTQVIFPRIDWMIRIPVLWFIYLVPSTVRRVKRKKCLCVCVSVCLCVCRFVEVKRTSKAAPAWKLVSSGFGHGEHEYECRTFSDHFQGAIWPPPLPGSKKHQKLFLSENSFPVVFRGVEPMEGFYVSNSHFRRGKNSERWSVRRLFLQRGEQLGRRIMSIHFNLPSCRCQQRRKRHFQVTIGSCQDDQIVPDCPM